MANEPKSFIIYSPYWIDYDEISSRAPRYTEWMRRITATPKSVVAVLMEQSTIEKLATLATDYRLYSDKASKLTRIVRDTLLGDSFIGDMPKLISTRLQLDGTSAKEIAARIIAEVFQPAMEDIKKIQLERFADRLNRTNAPIASPTNPNPSSTVETDENTIDLRNK